MSIIDGFIGYLGGTAVCLWIIRDWHKQTIDKLRNDLESARLSESSLQHELDQRNADWRSVSANLANEKAMTARQHQLLTECNNSRIEQRQSIRKNAEEIESLRDQIEVVKADNSRLIHENHLLGVEVKRQAMRINSMCGDGND